MLSISFGMILQSVNAAAVVHKIVVSRLKTTAAMRTRPFPEQLIQIVRIPMIMNVIMKS